MAVVAKSNVMVMIALEGHRSRIGLLCLAKGELIADHILMNLKDSVCCRSM
jgi:hypothetical protein